MNVCTTTKLIAADFHTKRKVTIRVKVNAARPTTNAVMAALHLRYIVAL